MSVPPLLQSRHLATEIPGPGSVQLARRRAKAVPRGVGSTLPVYALRAGGGIVEDVDGNRLIDLGSGIAVTTVGNAAPRVVEAVQQQVAEFTHTCFMVTPYEGYVAVAEALNRITPGEFEKRSVLLNSGAEALENAVKIARSYTRKTAVAAFDHGYHGRTNLTMALTAKSMPYKSGFGPFAPDIYRAPASYPYRDGLVDKELGSDGERAAERAIGVLRTRSAPTTWLRWSSNRSKARAASSSRLRVFCRRCWPGAAITTWCSSPTRCRRVSPAPGRCSPVIMKARQGWHRI